MKVRSPRGAESSKMTGRFDDARGYLVAETGVYKDVTDATLGTLFSSAAHQRQDRSTGGFIGGFNFRVVCYQRLDSVKEEDLIMGECAAQTFNNITPDKWLALQTKAAADNINLNGTSGETTNQGFTVTWQYDAASATLTIQCLNHPFWAPCGSVNGKIHDLVDSLG